MLKLHVTFKFTNTLLLVLALSSCVGTIDETPTVQPSVEGSKEKVDFAGVNACKAIGHDKIDVYFGQASVNGSSDQSNIVYQVFQDGNFDEAVATAIGNQIPTDENGLFHLMVSGIPKNTEASFVVRAFDSVSGTSDDNYITCLEKTLSTELPDFNGVREVLNYPGIEGRSTLQLFWTKAKPGKTIGSELPKAGYAIAGYKLYFGKDPANMELFTNIPVDSDNHPTSYKFTGLSPGIKYYFKMNAYDDSNRVDLNNIILSKQTNTPGTIEFDGVSKVTVPAGDSGYSTLVAHWEVANGDFNAYKIFAVPASDVSAFSNNSIGPNNVNYYVGKTEDVNQTSFTIPGLNKNMEYAIFVVACEAEAGTCDTKTTVPKGDTKKVVQITSPRLATYSGLQKVESLTGQAGLTQATLSWQAPIEDGVCEGIKVKRITSFSPVAGVEIPVCPSLSGGPCLSKQPSCTDTSVNVSSMQTGLQYCFQTAAYAELKETDPTNLNYECHTPQHTKPLFDDFPTCTSGGSTSLNITWSEAKNGLFTNYLLVYREIDGTKPSDPKEWFELFRTNFENGTLAGTGYEYKILPTTTFAKTLTSLKPNTDYRVMIKAYMSTGSDHYYDDNTSIPGGCTTDEIKLSSTGFNKIISVGPASKDLTIKDQFEIVNGDIKITSGKTLTSGTEYGVVHFEWNDPIISDSLKLSDLIDLLGGDTDPDNGFYIFKSTSTAPDLITYSRTDFVNSVSSNPNWQQVNSQGIKINPATRKASFTEEFTSLSGRTDATESRLIYYVIKFKFDGKFIDFQTNKGADYLIDVLLPPAGMVLQHRTMVNKKFCTLIGKKNSLDTNNHYRCPYDGMGSILDGASSFYDTKGHVLVDRMNLTCKKDDPIYNNVGLTVHYDKIKSLAVAVDDLPINECYVFVNINNNTADTPNISVAQSDAAVMEGSYYKRSTMFVNLGTNYKYKITNGYIYADGSSSSTYPNFRQLDFSVGMGQYYATDRLCGLYNIYESTETYTPIIGGPECTGTLTSVYTSTSGSVFSPPVIYTKIQKQNLETDYKLNEHAVSQTFNYTYYYDNNATILNDKSHYVFWTPPFSGKMTLQRGSNFLKHALPTLPSGRGFDEGQILNNDNSIFPAPLSNEIFGRSYSNNKYTSSDNERLWGIGKNISSNETQFAPSTTERWITTELAQDSSLRYCNGVFYDDNYIMTNGSFFISYYYVTCYDILMTKPYISNIPASTANYLCQSHYLNVKTPVKTYGPIRKRPMSAREVMSSVIPEFNNYSTYTENSFDDYGADFVKSSLYLAGQALCDVDGSGNGKCYTDPKNISSSKFSASNVADAYEASPTFASNSRWPFFKYTAAETQYPDQGMYKNQSNGATYFWQLIDSTNARNIAGTPSSEHFGIPQYTNAHANGGSIASNYPLTQYNPSYILGQPLWCDYEESAGLCGSDDLVDPNQLYSTVSVEGEKYIQSEVRAAGYTTYQANNIVPYTAVYAPGNFRDQYHIPHDYDSKTVTYKDISDVFSVRWTPLEEVPEPDVQVRCSVKLQFDDTGKLIEVDGIEVP